MDAGMLEAAWQALLAGEPVKQGVALDVITQVTISLFANEAFV